MKYVMFAHQILVPSTSCRLFPNPLSMNEDDNIFSGPDLRMKPSKSSSTKANAPIVFGSATDVFSTFANVESYKKALVGSAGIPEATSCLKLLSKKDSVTRSRALQDLINRVIPGLSSDEAFSFTSAFSYKYCKGALLDPDWKCRTLYHSALIEVYAKVGRKIEPALTEIFPVLLVSVCDLASREVSRAARRALEAVFPDEAKRRKVYMHLKSSVQEFISGNLASTEQTLSNQYRPSEENEESVEARDRWERVIAGSLRCLDFCFRDLGADDSQLEEYIAGINPKTYLKVSNGLLVCEAAAELCYSLIKHRGQTDSDSILVDALWDCLCSPEKNITTKTDWELLTLLSEYHAVITGKISEYIAVTDFRIMQCESLRYLKRILGKRDNGNEVKLVQVVVRKVASACLEDQRIVAKHVDTLTDLVDVALAIITKPYSKCVNEVVSLVHACEGNTRLLSHTFKDIIGKVEFNSGLRNVVVASAGELSQQVQAVLMSYVVIPTDQALLSMLPPGAWRFVLSSVKRVTPDLIDQINIHLCVAELSQKELIWMADVILSTFVHDSRFAEKSESVMNALGFSTWVTLVCGNVSEWTSRINATECIIPSLDELSSESSLQNAFIRAIDFDKPSSIQVSGDRYDNGLVVFGSDFMGQLLSEILAGENSQLRDRVIDTLATRRVNSGLNIYLSNEKAAQVWLAYVSKQRDPLLSVKKLIAGDPAVRACCVDLVVNSRRSFKDSEFLKGVLPNILPTRDERETILVQTIKAGSISVWFPYLSLFTDCPSFDKLVIGLACIDCSHEALSPILQQWAVCDTGTLAPIFSQIVTYAESQTDPFRVLPSLRVVAGQHEKTVHDVPIEEIILDLLQRDSDLFLLSVVRVLVGAFHISVGTSETVIELLNPFILRKDMEKSTAAASIALVLDSGHVLPDSFVPELEETSSIFRRREAEEHFADVIQYFYANHRKVTVKENILDLIWCIQSTSVSDTLLQNASCERIEKAFNLYRSHGLPTQDVSKSISSYLIENGSLLWATGCIASHTDIEIGLERLSKIALVTLLESEPILQFLRGSHELLIDEYIAMKLWGILLSKFLDVRSESFCFFLEYVSLSSPDLAIENLRSSLMTFGELSFRIIADVDRSPEDARAPLYGLALTSIPLFIQAISPGDVHDWISSSKVLKSSVAENIVVAHAISSTLVQSESLSNRYRNENLRTNFSLSSRMLICHYSSHDGEIQANLTVKFPDCWPLRLGQIEVSAVVGLSKAKNARLQVSIQSVFRMNGVQNAIQIWIENILGFLKDVEECYICYSVTYHHGAKGTGTGNGNGGSIPNKQCKTCKNKFHSACLLKYFKTSGKTICCLCQNPF